MQISLVSNSTQGNKLVVWLMSLLAIAMFSSSINFAQASDNPKLLLESVSDKMITALNDNRDRIKADPAVTQQLIEEILLPHLDFITASKYVLGKHWDTAERKQKIAFIKVPFVFGEQGVVASLD